jgi:4-alpha-glucanotransferase
MTRRAGLLVPLFSIPSTRSWGIGEIGDIEPLARWLTIAGQRLLQLLPINEMPPGERSPYSALSAMAIDPIFITLDDLEDFAEIGGEHGLDARLHATLDAVRLEPSVRYDAVRPLKEAVLRQAFAHFRDREWAKGTRRAAAFRAFMEDQAWWLEDYALFRALHARHGERPWSEWPAGVRRRAPAALAQARAELAGDILFRKYLQWVAADQWGAARDRAGQVALYGDLPFMVSGDSADVWARQDEFRLDASIGAPPDAFSETGQDWGMPAYRWDVFAERDFDWIRARARRYAELFDGYRVDHLVGFYRTYVRPRSGKPQFTPETEEEQRALGERILSLLRETGVDIVAEDLGTVPDFVRESLAAMGVPGFKVLRWERRWHVDGQPFTDPADYPESAVATTGTHDTEPLAVWWARAPREEREAVLEIPSIARCLTEEDRRTALEAPALPHALREALLESLFASPARFVILPIQDVFGWSDQINVPATVDASNWTWRLPWPSDRLTEQPKALAVAAQLKAWAERYQRWNS